MFGYLGSVLLAGLPAVWSYCLYIIMRVALSVFGPTWSDSENARHRRTVSVWHAVSVINTVAHPRRHPIRLTSHATPPHHRRINYLPCNVLQPTARNCPPSASQTVIITPGHVGVRLHWCFSSDFDKFKKHAKKLRLEELHTYIIAK